MSRRRRGGGPQLTTIWWRDIPAQVNGVEHDRKAQWILPQRFQVAIDKAALIGDASDTDTYVAQWHQTVTRIESDLASPLEDRAKAEASRLDTKYDSERLTAIVDNGGWNPDAAHPTAAASAEIAISGEPETGRQHP
ncbi:MAG: hypothetical protein GY708_13210 [Actinomycetia bacterium]|nr:hypothetical protein [Actinomycetes bacterium]